MNKSLSRVGLAIGIGGTCLLLIGCPHGQHTGDKHRPLTGTYPHNLKHLDCAGHAGENYVIELEATQELLKNKKDKVVFVCPGDTLTWKIGGGTSTTIDVSVKPPFEEDLFGAGNSHVTSTTGAATSKEVTGDSSKHAYFFKYDLVVKVGSSTFTLDPHVIPTGN